MGHRQKNIAREEKHNLCGILEEEKRRAEQLRKWMWEHLHPPVTLGNEDKHSEGSTVLTLWQG